MDEFIEETINLIQEMDPEYAIQHLNVQRIKNFRKEVLYDKYPQYKEVVDKKEESLREVKKLRFKKT